MTDKKNPDAKPQTDTEKDAEMLVFSGQAAGMYWTAHLCTEPTPQGLVATVTLHHALTFKAGLRDGVNPYDEAFHEDLKSKIGHSIVQMLSGEWYPWQKEVTTGRVN